MSRFVATSRIVPTVERSRRIEPLFAPVVPAVETLTFHTVAGAPPTGVAEVTVGALPPVLLVARVKLPVVTLFTGSSKVTAQVSGLSSSGSCLCD